MWLRLGQGRTSVHLCPAGAPEIAAGLGEPYSLVTRALAGTVTTVRCVSLAQGFRQLWEPSASPFVRGLPCLAAPGGGVPFSRVPTTAPAAPVPSTFSPGQCPSGAPATAARHSGVPGPPAYAGGCAASHVAFLRLRGVAQVRARRTGDREFPPHTALGSAVGPRRTRACGHPPGSSVPGRSCGLSFLSKASVRRPGLWAPRREALGSRLSAVRARHRRVAQASLCGFRHCEDAATRRRAGRDGGWAGCPQTELGGRW